MANGTLYAMAGIDQTEHLIVQTMGRQLLYDAVQQYLSYKQEVMQGAMSTFVEGQTVEWQENYPLPMTGKMSRTAPGAAVSPITVKGRWTVEYPLHQFEDMFATTDVDFAYMTPEQFEQHIDGVFGRYLERVRFEVLKSLLNKTNESVKDRLKGDLTIRRLANNDGAVYPPALGSETLRTTLNSYLASGYTAANISDTNNPYVTLDDHLADTWGFSDTGDTIAWIHKDQEAKTAALTNFIPVAESNIRLSDSNEYLIGGVPTTVPGRVIGTVDNVVIAKWEWMPTNYILAVNANTNAPLKMRVDPAYTGLGAGGLQSVEVGDVTSINFNQWRARFGMGVGNRLNGVAMELTTDASYDTPTAYL